MADVLVRPPGPRTRARAGGVRAHGRGTRRVLVAPTVLPVLVLALYPLAFLVAASVSRSSLGRPFGGWVGTANLDAVLRNPDVAVSLVRTTVYALGVSAASVVLGVALALALERVLRGAAVVRTVLLLPLVVPPVIAGTLWKLVFNPGGGLLPTALSAAGVDPSGVAPLSSTRWALTAIGLVDVWQWTPLVTLLVLAALLGQPREVGEAAALDGASGLALIRHVTLPPVLGIVAATFLIRLVIAFKVFDLVHVMTSGGPGRSSTVSSYVVYQAALREFDVGRASVVTLALAVVVTAVTVPVAVLTRRLQHRAD